MMSPIRTQLENGWEWGRESFHSSDVLERNFRGARWYDIVLARAMGYRQELVDTLPDASKGTSIKRLGAAIARHHWRLFAGSPYKRWLREYARREDMAPTAAKEQIASQAVLLAVQRGRKPQKVKVDSKRWIRDAHGNLWTIRPTIDLPTGLFARWLRHATVGEAQEELEREMTFSTLRFEEEAQDEDRPPPALSEGSMRDAGDLLHRLLTSEETRLKIEEVRAESSPQQERLLFAYLETGSWAEAGRMIGIPPNQADQQAHRLKKKFEGRR